MLGSVFRILRSQPKRITAGSAVTAVCTLVGDLLEPIAHFTIYFLIASVVILAGCLFRLSYWQRAVGSAGDPERDMRLEGVRLLLPLSLFGIVFTSGLLAWDQVQDASDKARKELAGLGVQWDTQDFVDAMINGDARVVDLFLAGGMKPEALHKGSSAILYAIQRNTADPIGAVQRAIAAGFDVNTRLIDTRTVLDPKAIHHFEGPNVPDGYAAWQSTFAGPMLLWLTCRMTWSGGNETDWKLVELLLDNGADVRAAFDYLEFNRNGLGRLDGTGTYAGLHGLLAARLR